METADRSLRGEFLLKLARIIVPLLIVVAVAIAILALIFGLRWAAEPYLGLMFSPRLVVSDVYNPNLVQLYPGVQPNDILTALNDAPMASGRQLYLQLQGYQPGQTVTLTLKPPPGSPAQTPQNLVATLTVFTLQDLLRFFWLPYGTSLIYLAMGLVVYRLRGADQISSVLVSFCSLVAIVLTGLFDLHSLQLLTPVWVVALPLVGATLLHLALVFPAETRLYRRQPWLLYLPYAVAFVLGGFNLFNLYQSPNPLIFEQIWLWSFNFVGLSVLLFWALLLNARGTIFSPVIRQQTTLIIWGSLLAFGPITLWAFMVDMLGFTLVAFWFEIALACLVVFPIVIAYAALRYRLLDLDQAFSRAMVYTLLIILVTLVYFLVVSLLAVLLRDVDLFKNPIVFIQFILFLVITLGPVKERLEAWVKRTFLHEPADFRQLLQRYGQALVSAPLNVESILELMLRQTDEALNPQRGLVFMEDELHEIFVVRYRHNGPNGHTIEVSFASGDDLVRWLVSTNDILQISPTGAVAEQVEVSREELARLTMLGISLCIPLMGANQLIGWLALGPKKTGQPYTSNDLLFLATLASQTTIALESAQLLEQANQRAAEMEALQTISADIQAKTESDQLLTSVVAQATRLLQADGGLVYLLEPDNETLKVVVSYKLAQNYTGLILAKGEGVAGQVAQRGETMIIDNYQGYVGRSPQFQEANFGAVLSVPLRTEGQVRGVLDLVHRSRGRHFSQRDIWLMELFATQAAIALQKSRLLQETQLRATQLAALSEVSVAISSTLNLDVALERVMAGAVQILTAEAGSLLLLDPRGKELTFEVVLGPTGAELRGQRTPIGKGIVGTVAKTGDPLIVNNAPADPRWNIAFDEATNFRTRDILCVPMLAHERVVGVVEVINKKDGTTFDADDCRLLMSFGAQAAIAIENAQIFTRTDKALAERVQELQALQMFDRELQTSLNLKHVLDISLTRAMDALGLEMGLMGVIKEKEGEDPELYLLMQRGMPMEMSRYKRDPWPLTRGIIGRVVRTGEIAWINDITLEKDYTPNSHRTRSVLAVPVMLEDKVIGIIDLESTHPDSFTSDDVSFIRLLLSPAAIAIKNAQLYEQVNEANQAKTEFMNIASHELKIPMTSIKGYAKLLQMGAGGGLSDQQKDFVGVIAGNVDRMARLVNDLLDVSRIEAGRIRLEIQNVQMREVIDEVLESVRTQLENKHLNLNLEIDGNLPLLRADYGRIVQILTNLVSNAYKYTSQGGEVKVMAKPYQNNDLDGIAVTVKDTGYGISPDDQIKLFTKFFRSNDQNIRDEPGTGLGLSITKSMIEAHGGELSVESELGQGTAFTFILPLICKIPPGVEVIER